MSEMAKLEERPLDEENSEIELDLLPEHCHYRDEGCDLADSCLHCPFPQCIYELPGGRQRWLKKLRDREIARLFNECKGVKELASMFGVSQRTVQRTLRSLFLTSQVPLLSPLVKVKNSERENSLNKGDLSKNE